MTRIAIVGGHGKTGRAVGAALTERGAEPVPLGRADWPDLAARLSGCGGMYLIAPNFHPDEPAYVEKAISAAQTADIELIVYHSVASPYLPQLPHHLGKARGEDLVRQSSLDWTILQPGVYLQNFDLTGPELRVPYDVHAWFGLLDLADLGAAAATVLLESGHVGATYELASRQATPQVLADEAGIPAVSVEWTPEDLDGREQAWLQAMFAYYDRYGLPVGTLPLRALLGRR